MHKPLFHSNYKRSMIVSIMLTNKTFTTDLLIHHRLWQHPPRYCQLATTTTISISISSFPISRFSFPRSHFQYHPFWCPGTEAVDAFMTDWGADINWPVSPLHLIANALQHAKACTAKGTLAFPAWKSSYFWPIICPDGRHLAEFIHKWCYLAFFT